METLICKLLSRTSDFVGLNAVRALGRYAGVVSLGLLGGCGAMWDSVYPPQDPRDALSFHAASMTAYADWSLRTGPLGHPQIFIQPAPLFTAASIEMAAPMVDARKQYFVGVKLDPQATRRLAAATQAAVPVSSVVLKPVAPGPALSGTGSGWQGHVALLQKSQLISVMPVDQPISTGTFAIPVRNAAAAQELSDALNARPN